jgi:arabinose-5-phosphate isomerase
LVALREAADPEVEEARHVLREQSGAIADLAERVDERFTRALDALQATEGHVAVVGVGKSGLIGRKIASTLASTGTPSFFVNAAEALHGDLGMVTSKDIALVVSQSGQTVEVVQLLPHLRRLGVRIVALVGSLDSALGHDADVAVDVSVDHEVCPNNLAPTTSALAALAMGDALAVALMRRRGFGSRDFARFHPGGRLGRRLLTPIKDVMRRGDLPIVKPTDTVGEALVVITRGRLGLVLVMTQGRLQGIVTDGDLRRGMQRHKDLLELPVAQIMTKSPVTILEDVALAEAHERMQASKLKALVAVNVDGQVTGIVEVFDVR